MLVRVVPSGSTYEGYTTHRSITYIGPGKSNTCVDMEGGPACKKRCEANPACIMFGLYERGYRAGRCCIKFYGPEVGERGWGEGSHFVKEGAFKRHT